MDNLSPRVCIVLLNYNGATDTIECLESLNGITYNNYNIVIVDNASTDDSMDRLNEYLRTLDVKCGVFSSPGEAMGCHNLQAKWTLLQTCHNGGFGYGNNIGIKYALENKTDYILVINNDTVVDPNFLEPMVALCEEDKRIGIVSGKIYFYDKPDVIWFNGGRFNSYTTRVRHANYNEKDVGQNPPETITFITGCVWLLPRSTFDHVGLINEKYFMYVEDLEYSQRVLSRGYTLRICQKSHIWHKVGSSSGGHLSSFSVYWTSKNSFKFIKSEPKKFKKLCAYAYLLFFISLRFVVNGNHKLLKYHLLGIYNAIRY